jgi:hypothetical protein
MVVFPSVATTAVDELENRDRYGEHDRHNADDYEELALGHGSIPRKGRASGLSRSFKLRARPLQDSASVVLYWDGHDLARAGNFQHTAASQNNR